MPAAIATRIMKLNASLALAAALGALGAPAHAQPYPSKLIRIVVPFPSGGPTDLYGRIIAQELQKAWGQSVVVEDRPGATGALGSAVVQQAPPDGYTLLVTSNSAHVIGPLLRTPRTFDGARDFTPVTKLISFPMYLLVHPALPVHSLAEFIKLAKSRPGELNYSSVGVGSGGHLACELFNIAAGTHIVHVPYNGAAPAQLALVTGETQLMCDSVGNSQPMVVAGKLRGLAVTGAKRSPAVPEVPTLKESGLPVEAYIWLGLLGPANLPSAIAGKLHDEVVRIMNLPEVRERVLTGGSEVATDTPEEFAAEIRSETEVWAKVIREKGIKE